MNPLDHLALQLLELTRRVNRIEERLDRNYIPALADFTSEDEGEPDSSAADD